MKQQDYKQVTFRVKLEEEAKSVQLLFQNKTDGSFFSLEMRRLKSEEKYFIYEQSNFKIDINQVYFYQYQFHNNGKSYKETVLRSFQYKDSSNFEVDEWNQVCNVIKLECDVQEFLNHLKIITIKSNQQDIQKFECKQQLRNCCLKEPQPINFQFKQTNKSNEQLKEYEFQIVWQKEYHMNQVHHNINFQQLWKLLITQIDQELEKKLKKSEKQQQSNLNELIILDALQENQEQSQIEKEKQINQLKYNLQFIQNENKMLKNKTLELEKDIKKQEVYEINVLHQKIKEYQFQMDSCLYIENLLKKELNCIMQNQDFKQNINLQDFESQFQTSSLENKVLHDSSKIQIEQDTVQQYLTELEHLIQDNKTLQAKFKLMQQQQEYLSLQQQKQTEEFVKYADRTIQKYKNEIDYLQQSIQAIYKKEIEKLLDIELFDESQMEKIKKYSQKCDSNSLDQIYQEYIVSLENLENEKQTSRKIIYDQFNPIHVYQEKIEKLKQFIQICKTKLIDYFNEIEEVEQHQLQQEQNYQNQKLEQKKKIIIKLKSEIKLANSNFEKLEKSFNENKQKLQEAEEFEKNLFKLFQQQTEVYNQKIEETKKSMVGKLNIVQEN